MNALASTTPWYRQRWPWLLMAGPAIVVVAGFATLAMAIRSDDGLVADDYYKQGLAINRSLERTDAAAARRIQATVDVAADGRVAIELAGQGPWPGTVHVRLAHPTRAGADLVADARATADGRYVAVLPEFVPGRWRVDVEATDWKLPSVEVSGATLHADLGP